MTDVLFNPERSLFDPTAPLTASGNLRRRTVVSRVVTSGATAAAFLAAGVLIFAFAEVVARGAPAISFNFLFTNPSAVGGGGIFNAIVGTLEIAAFAGLLAVPVGVLTGLYLSEFAGQNAPTARFLKLVLDLLQGLPTIIVGVVVFGLIEAGTTLQTGFAASVALAIVILPLIARSSQEVLAAVPENLREAADALGVERWRTVLGIILPAASSGIVTASILGVARAAGETAPLVILDTIFTNGTQLNLFGQGVPSIPIYIFDNYDVPGTAAVTRVWGAALVLLTMILIANIAARILFVRSLRRMRG